MVLVLLINAVVIGIAGYQILKTAHTLVKGIKLSEAIDTLRPQKSDFSSTFASIRSSFMSSMSDTESERTLQCTTSCTCDSYTTYQSDVQISE